MKKFNNVEEMKPYLNKKTGTYEFVERRKLLDIAIMFDLIIYGNILAGDIKAGDIKAGDITCCNISARDIKAFNINAWHITARSISSGNIRTIDINAVDINSGNIEADSGIIAYDINANNIDALAIEAHDIKFYAACFAHKNIVCNTITGKLENAKYFSLEGDVFIGTDKRPKGIVAEFEALCNSIRFL